MVLSSPNIYRLLRSGRDLEVPKDLEVLVQIREHFYSGFARQFLTAKLRTTKTGDNRLLLKTNMGAGHGGKSGRYSRLEEQAFVYAFLLDAVGIGE